MERVKIQILGDVQGVFFRHFTKEKAKSLGINGWCRNNQDGSVLIIVEGEETDINEFVSWCYHGSPMAVVHEVKVEEEKYIGEERGFEIR